MMTTGKRKRMAVPQDEAWKVKKENARKSRGL